MCACVPCQSSCVYECLENKVPTLGNQGWQHCYAPAAQIAIAAVPALTPHRAALRAEPHLSTLSHPCSLVRWCLWRLADNDIPLLWLKIPAPQGNTMARRQAASGRHKVAKRKRSTSAARRPGDQKAHKPRDKEAWQPCPEARRYRHVVWHKAMGGWIGQVSQDGGRQRTLDGVKTNQLAAAKLVAAALKLEVRDLLLKPKQPKAKAKFHHIYPCSGRDRGWRVVYRGEFLGNFSSEQDAAQFLCQHANIGLQDLRKSNKSMMPAIDLQKRMQALAPVFQDKLPGDLEAAVIEQTKSRAMFLVSPCLELLSHLGKYGPWRKNLRLAYRAHLDKTGKAIGRLDDQETCVALRGILEAATRLCDGDCMELWIANCSKGVSHVLGFLPMLIRLGCIRPLLRSH